MTLLYKNVPCYFMKFNVPLSEMTGPSAPYVYPDTDPSAPYVYPYVCPVSVMTNTVTMRDSDAQ